MHRKINHVNDYAITTLVIDVIFFCAKIRTKGGKSVNEE